MENTSKGIVSQLEEKEKEIAYLKERDLKHDIEMKAVNDRMAKLDQTLDRVMKLEKGLGLA